MTDGWYAPFEESIRLEKAMETPGVRWYVRREHTRGARFGENARDSLAWASFPYVDRDSTGAPIRITAPTFHPTRDAALAHAAKRTAQAAANALRLAALNTAVDADRLLEKWSG